MHVEPHANLAAAEVAVAEDDVVTCSHSAEVEERNGNILFQELTRTVVLR